MPQHFLHRLHAEVQRQCVGKPPCGDVAAVPIQHGAQVQEPRSPSARK